MCSITAIDPRPPEPPPDKPPLEELEREICELAAHIDAATCRWLLLVAEFDERRGWAEWGVHSCAHWLSWRCSIAPRSARERLRVARRLRELPYVRAAFSVGELSYSKVRALTRVAESDTEQDLVQIARHATGAQLDKLVRGYGKVLSATREAAQSAHERRYARWQWEDDGSLRLQARIPPDEGALLIAALNAATRSADAYREPEANPSSALVRSSEPAEARSADALVDIARAALVGNPADRVGGDPCEVVVHVDAETLIGDQVNSCSEIAGGPVLPPETVRRLGCDAGLVRIIERDGRPLSVGRRTRTVPPALRRALRRRDGGCRFPGCEHRRFLHAHHIEHWASGGPTNIDNLVQLCSFHHRLVHEGGYTVERSGTHTLCFRRPDGRSIPAVGRSTRARGPGLRRQNGARGLLIDSHTCMPLSAGDSIDYGLAVDALLSCRRKPPDAGPP
jgi:Domain of unknown function (DUF222)/HNH endonuclease